MSKLYVGGDGSDLDQYANVELYDPVSKVSTRWPQLKLTDVMLWGSHDALCSHNEARYYSKKHNGINCFCTCVSLGCLNQSRPAVTQVYNMKEQLDRGVRLFDVRFHVSGGRIYGHHDKMFAFQEMHEVAAHIREWATKRVGRTVLKSNQGRDIAILRVKVSGPRDPDGKRRVLQLFQQLLDGQIQDNSRTWIPDEDHPGDTPTEILKPFADWETSIVHKKLNNNVPVVPVVRQTMQQITDWRQNFAENGTSVHHVKWPAVGETAHTVVLVAVGLDPDLSQFHPHENLEKDNLSGGYSNQSHATREWCYRSMVRDQTERLCGNRNVDPGPTGAYCREPRKWVGNEASGNPNLLLHRFQLTITAGGVKVDPKGEKFFNLNAPCCIPCCGWAPCNLMCGSCNKWNIADSSAKFIDTLDPHGSGIQSLIKKGSWHPWYWLLDPTHHCRPAKYAGWPLQLAKFAGPLYNDSGNDYLAGTVVMTDFGGIEEFTSLWHMMYEYNKALASGGGPPSVCDQDGVQRKMNATVDRSAYWKIAPPQDYCCDGFCWCCPSSVRPRRKYIQLATSCCDPCCGPGYRLWKISSQMKQGRDKGKHVRCWHCCDVMCRPCCYEPL